MGGSFTAALENRANSSGGGFGNSCGRFWEDLRKVLEVSFLPKTEPLKGKEKKMKRKENTDQRQKSGGLPVDNLGFAEKD